MFGLLLLNSHGLYHFLCDFNELSLILPVADLKGGARDTCPPGGPISFNFMQFLGKFGKILC